MALSVLLDPQAATLLAGTYVADGAALDKAVRAFKEVLDKENPTVAGWLKLDAERSGEIRFHEATIPVGPDAKDREKVVQLFGPEVHVVLGVGPHAAYLAAGRDALPKLQQAIAASARFPHGAAVADFAGLGADRAIRSRFRQGTGTSQVRLGRRRPAQRRQLG